MIGVLIIPAMIGCFWNSSIKAPNISFTTLIKGLSPSSSSLPFWTFKRNSITWSFDVSTSIFILSWVVIFEIKNTIVSHLRHVTRLYRHEVLIYVININKTISNHQHCLKYRPSMEPGGRTRSSPEPTSFLDVMWLTNLRKWEPVAWEKETPGTGFDRSWAIVLITFLRSSFSSN